MQFSYAVLIDGGFLKHKLGSRIKPMTAEDVAHFVEKLKNTHELKNHHLHRIYYYDAYPSTDTVKKPLSGESLDFTKTGSFLRNRKLYMDLVNVPFLALRMGEVVHNGWQISQRILKTDQSTVSISSNDLKPMISQKGVDMRIGLDIAALTLKKQVHVIVLVTGDSDFVPAMKFARKEGVQLFLVTLGHGIRETMREHSDILLSIELDELRMDVNR